jgi:hypothetical protein
LFENNSLVQQSVYLKTGFAHKDEIFMYSI